MLFPPASRSSMDFPQCMSYVPYRYWTYFTALFVVFVCWLVEIDFGYPHPDDHPHYADTRSLQLGNSSVPNALNVLSTFAFGVSAIAVFCQVVVPKLQASNLSLMYHSHDFFLCVWLILLTFVGAFYHSRCTPFMYICESFVLSLIYSTMLHFALCKFTNEVYSLIEMYIFYGLCGTAYGAFLGDWSWYFFLKIASLIAPVIHPWSKRTLYMVLLHFASILTDICDLLIFRCTLGLVSGHSLSHILMAAACYFMTVQTQTPPSSIWNRNYKQHTQKMY